LSLLELLSAVSAAVARKRANTKRTPRANKEQEEENAKKRACIMKFVNRIIAGWASIHFSLAPLEKALISKGCRVDMGGTTYSAECP
jgi:hypothetical protein